MEFASSILSSVFTEIGKCLVGHSIHQANYLLRFKNIVEDLEKGDANLRLKKDRVQQEVEGARRNTEEIEKDVEKWQMDVQNVLEEIQRLKDEIELNKTILCGRCPNWRWRYKLSRRAVKKTSEMLKLLESGNFIRVAHSTTLPDVEGPKDFISFKPMEDSSSQIMEALKNDKINRVGLYGMGGVGKTTLAKVVGKEAREKKLFDEVVMVTVTQNPNVENIQSRIAELLGLKFEEKTTEGRAQRLLLRLGDKKKTLLILDDVWKILDLKPIGIPFGDDHKGCTILLTTRLRQVCIDMKCQTRIHLDTLNEEEGLILFNKHVGICNDSPMLNAVAKEVVGECGGLPLAIEAIGSALREKDVDEWKVASKKLKMSKFPEIEAVDRNVYACLELSYDYLKEDTKFCFLLCSLFPEDYEIGLEELLKFGLGLDLYRDADTIEEARSQLRVTINNLKSSCLLLDDEEGFVKMHDLVRDVALWITSIRQSNLLNGENVFMVKAGMGLTEWQKHEGLEQCTAISLMGNDIERIPNGLVCPKLNILLLEGNNVEVSNEFFEEMKKLKVASLNWVHLSLNSLQSLTNLVTLQLIHCELSDISLIKKLAQLEILRLKDSLIVELPEELGELSKLRMLDITDCRELKRIPANVIPRLSRLEELYIGNNSFTAWEVEGTSAEGSNASLSELSKLDRLTILSLCINVQPRLPKDFVLLKKLLRYCVTVNYKYMEEPYPKSRIFTIEDIEATSLFEFKALWEKVEYIKWVRIKGCCQNIVPSIDATGLNELKRLSLSYFDELECIIDTTQQQDVPSTAFSNLVDLSLDSVSLREICSGGRPPRVFLENLETLNISSCDSMSNSLFPSWIQRLRKLKKVTVYWCRELEDVFQLEGLCYAKENPFLLSSLESLHLSGLRNLRYIWKGPNQQVSLQSLTVVKVVLCHQLRYLFTLSLARSLLQLEELEVRGCGSLEHIVEIKEAEENVGGGGGNDVMFPKLRILKLDGLKNFISFFDSENYSSIWPALKELSLYLPLNSTTSFVAQLEANMLQTSKEKLRVLDVGIESDQLCNSVLAQLIHGFQKLEELKIRECRVQVLSQLELSLPSLKVLDLYGLEELECLCKGPTHLLSLPNLKKLTVYSCNRLRHMFSPSLARNLLQLEELIIWNCGKLEQMFIEDDAAEYNQTLSKDHFQWPLLSPNLSLIDIRRCDKLKSMFPVSITHLLSLQNLTTLKLDTCHGLTHLFSSTLARNLLQLERIDIEDCGELEQIIDEDHTKDDHVQLGLFPNLSSISVRRCDKLKSLFPVSMAHLLSLQNLTALKLRYCHGLTHLFSSTTLAQNLLQLESIDIMDCKELEQIIVEDRTEDDHVQLGLFPNLSSISVYGCGKLKTLFPAVTIARSGLQKLRTLDIRNSFQLEELFGHKDAADMTSDREMVLPQLKMLTLRELESLVNFCPVGYHFIFPSLSYLIVLRCPKIATRFSVDQNRSVHAEAKATQTGKEDVDMEQSSLETTKEIECWDFVDLQSQLPPYIGK